MHKEARPLSFTPAYSLAFMARGLRVGARFFMPCGRKVATLSSSSSMLGVAPIYKREGIMSRLYRTQGADPRIPQLDGLVSPRPPIEYMHTQARCHYLWPRSQVVGRKPARAVYLRPRQHYHHRRVHGGRQSLPSPWCTAASQGGRRATGSRRPGWLSLGAAVSSLHGVAPPPGAALRARPL